MIEIVQYDTRINRTAYYLALTSTFINFSLFTYLILIIPCLVEYEINDYMAYCPKVIYSILFNSLFLYVVCNITIWPIWGSLSLIMSAVIFIAFMVCPNLIPTCC